MVDDEFSRLIKFNEEYSLSNDADLKLRRLKNPNGVFRLLPDGKCSHGTDILKKLHAKTPKWEPGKIDAAVFLEKIKLARRNSDISSFGEIVRSTNPAQTIAKKKALMRWRQAC